MATSLPWSVKGVDPRTRDAAKAAARRAGMTLGEWLDHKLNDEAPAPSTPPEQLDIAALSERLARLSQGQMDTAPQQAVSAPRNAPLPSRGEIDAVLAQAASIEKLTRESSAKTVGALDSIARWIEKAENRMSTGERAAAERQERATNVIAEAIKTMGERLTDIERKSSEAPRASSRPEQAPRLAFSRDGLAAAVTDIRSRQRMLDDDEAPAATHRPAMAESRISALRDDLRELSARIAPAAPRSERPAAPARSMPVEREPQPSQIEAMLADLASRLDRLDTRDRLEPVLKPLARIESEVSRLSQDRSGESYQRFELEIAHLAAKVDALAARGGDHTMLAPVLREIADMRDMLASSSGEARLGELSQQISGLSFEIDGLRGNRPDSHELHTLTLAIDEIRNAILTDRGSARLQDLEPLASLSLQIESLASKIELRPGRAIEDRIDALQERIEALAEKGPAAVTRQIEALAGRIENLAASSNLAQLVNESPAVQVAHVDLGPVEEMLRNLAEKIDEAGRPGAETSAFDALEQQISGLAQRLDSAAATRSAETGMERTLQDLVVHLRSLREETTEAAERAARAAMSDHLDQAAQPASGIAELSTLVSGLHQSHVSSGRETQDAIGAVHQTLETIISRLSSLEAELVADRQAAAPPAPARTPMPPRVAAAERMAARPPVMPAAMGLAMEDRIGAPEVTAPARTEAPATPAAVTATAGSAPLTAALDLPLEPGSGRPRADAVLAGGHDTQSIRQNLIAAARRSAKAATEAASAPAAGAPEPAKSGGRLKEIMEKRKRPLLLGLAALVLALGTAHLVTNALKGPRTAAVGEAVQSPIVPKEEAPVETPAKAPAKDQSSALQPAPASPAQPMLAAAPPLAAEITGSTTQPSASPAPAAAPSLGEPVEAVTGIGELPAGLGSPGLRKAALDGNARAVYELASRAADGPAASRDPKLALRLFERAAVAGLAPAQFRLGNMFEKGLGTARDLSLARVWYMRAAERGNAKAMHNLAVLHAEGVSGKPDYATATDWFRRAAEFGVRDSQYNLAVLLGRGLGAPADLAQSYLWFSVAASQGDDDAGKKRDEVAQRLGATDLAAAKAEAAGWKPKSLDAAANEVTPPAKGWDETPTAAATKKPVKPARS
ncbi:tetratricopeptide repeat protein [Bosea sp. 124]|uniref:tetratricopeptide repeat protein n=1 Tax=Bosea sp. 124 TaxID=2135642 RepID=UPI000D43FADD|nr:tetratricopeptide repeat protein [Bosea sp. 124]PTM39093.1 localization factor PodJL [Bosea sp. 124]